MRNISGWELFKTLQSSCCFTPCRRCCQRSRDVLQVGRLWLSPSLYRNQSYHDSLKPDQEEPKTMWENLETIQSSHRIQLEINIYFDWEDTKCMSGFWKPLYNIFPESIVQKQLTAWYCGYPRTGRKRFGNLGSFRICGTEMTCSRTLEHGDCVKKKKSVLPATWELPVWMRNVLRRVWIRHLISKVFLHTRSHQDLWKERDTSLLRNVRDGLTAFPGCVVAI